MAWAGTRLVGGVASSTRRITHSPPDTASTSTAPEPLPLPSSPPSLLPPLPLPLPLPPPLPTLPLLLSNNPRTPLNVFAVRPWDRDLSHCTVSLPSLASSAVRIPFPPYNLLRRTRELHAQYNIYTDGSASAGTTNGGAEVSSLPPATLSPRMSSPPCMILARH